eukprot:483335-Amphidinium_carterae.2
MAKPAAKGKQEVVQGQPSNSTARLNLWGFSLRFSLSLSLASSLFPGEPAWIDQLTEFIKIVVPEERVYLLGNSLGAHRADQDVKAHTKPRL